MKHSIESRDLDFYLLLNILLKTFIFCKKIVKGTGDLDYRNYPKQNNKTYANKKYNWNLIGNTKKKKANWKRQNIIDRLRLI